MQKRNPPFKGRVGQGILSQEGLFLNISYTVIGDNSPGFG
jgi:hypothetical protein